MEIRTLIYCYSVAAGQKKRRKSVNCLTTSRTALRSQSLTPIYRRMQSDGDDDEKSLLGGILGGGDNYEELDDPDLHVGVEDSLLPYKHSITSTRYNRCLLPPFALPWSKYAAAGGCCNTKKGRKFIRYCAHFGDRCPLTTTAERRLTFRATSFVKELTRWAIGNGSR